MTETLPLWIEVPISLLLLAGGAFTLLGSIGLTRLRDFLMRVHAPTKVSTLGIGLLLIASMLLTLFGGGRIAVHELLITLFLFMTAPISAHLLVRAALKRRPELQPHPTGADPTDTDPQLAYRAAVDPASDGGARDGG